MKKKSYVLGLLVAAVVLIFAGCSGSKALKPEDFAKAFADEIFYGKADKSLESEIQDYKGFKEMLDEQGDAFAEGMTAGMSAFGGEVTDEQGNEVYDNFAKSVKEKTSFKVKSAKDENKKRTIVYEVTGLDGRALMKDYMSKVEAMSTELSNEITANPEAYASKTQDEILAEFMPKILTAFNEAIQNAEASSTPVEITIEFEKDGGLWKYSGDETDFANLYTAFFFGAANQSEAALMMSGM